MSDLVKRLDNMGYMPHLPSNVWEIIVEAKDTIEALQAENARLRAALSLYSCEDGCNDCPVHERDRVGCGWTARTALTDPAAPSPSQGSATETDER